MHRSFRESTIKKRQDRLESELRLVRQKVIRKKKPSGKISKSKDLTVEYSSSEKVKLNEFYIQDEFVRLSSISVDQESVSSGSYVSLEWDPKHDVDTPPKDELDLGTDFYVDVSEGKSPESLRKRSSSISINRVVYVSSSSGEIIDLQPVNRHLEFQPLEETFLERNLNLQLSATNNLEEIVEESTNMDLNVFNEHLKRLKQGFRKAQRKIGNFDIKFSFS